MSRKELISFAKEKGYELSEAQIKKWRSAGIVHPPKRVSTDSKGSSYVYDDVTKENILLALSSTKKRSLDELVLDIWVRGGKIATSDLQRIFTKYIKDLSEGTKALKRLSITENFLRDSRGFIPFVDLNAKRDTLQVMLSVISPSDNRDAIWNTETILDGDISTADISHQVLGIDELKKHDSDISESPKTTLDKTKSALNLSALKQGIQDKSFYDEAQKSFPVIETMMIFLCEVAPLYGLPNPLYRFMEWLQKYIESSRPIAIIGLLACYRDHEAHAGIQSIVETFNKDLECYQARVNWIRHMKKHPALKKRKNWGYYFQEIASKDEKMFDSIRKHHMEYVEANPSLISYLDM